MTTTRPVRISGALHYFRIHPDQWGHRIRSLRHLGLDTIETYVPWNLHEPRPGAFDFDGIADLGRFLDLIAAEGMEAIVRPGPYICAEWENGGLPAWLTGRAGVRLRTSDPAFLDPVDAWFDELIPVVADRQAPGPVVMVQVENEYGSYGSDAIYLDHLRKGLVERGITVPLFTSDGPTEYMLSGGSIPGVPATVNFGSRPDESFELFSRFRPDDDLFCMEYWNGWFDHWGEPHHTRDTDDAAGVLARMLELGASVNLYMAHGGTNFGCTAGANTAIAGEGTAPAGTYQPTITSYDYDAALDESGRPTRKFKAFRKVIAGSRTLPAIALPAPPPLLTPGTVEVVETLDLRATFDRIATLTTTSPFPPTYEELGLTHGLVRYRTHLDGPREEGDLTLPGLADRAHVYADGELLGIVDRTDPDAPPLRLTVAESGVDLEIWVESMGRVNYGPELGERKGLVGGVRHHRQLVHGWSIDALGFDLLPGVPDLPWDQEERIDELTPAWHRGTFTADQPSDAYVALDGWSKGYVWVNGFCLGRYWDRGPQRALYLPAPVVREGANEVVILDLDGTTATSLDLRDSPDLG